MADMEVLQKGRERGGWKIGHYRRVAAFRLAAS